LQNKKKDGTKINVYFNASNLLIETLNEDDKKRFKRRKLKVKTEEPKKEEKSATNNELNIETKDGLK